MDYKYCPKVTYDKQQKWDTATHTATVFGAITPIINKRGPIMPKLSGLFHFVWGEDQVTSNDYVQVDSD